MPNPQNINGEFIQKVLPIDALGNSTDGAINSINGQMPGTLFGDNFVIAQRVPSLSGRWSEGIPAQGFDISVVANAYWQIIEAGGYFDGSVECMSGTTANGFFFATTKKLNRYQDGIQSYFTGTFAFMGLPQSNGDFEILVGAMRRGLAGYWLFLFSLCVFYVPRGTYFVLMFFSSLVWVGSFSSFATSITVYMPIFSAFSVSLFHLSSTVLPFRNSLNKYVLFCSIVFFMV